MAETAEYKITVYSILNGSFSRKTTVPALERVDPKVKFATDSNDPRNRNDDVAKFRTIRINDDAGSERPSKPDDPARFNDHPVQHDGGGGVHNTAAPDPNRNQVLAEEVSDNSGRVHLPGTVVVAGSKQGVTVWDENGKPQHGIMYSISAQLSTTSYAHLGYALNIPIKEGYTYQLHNNRDESLSHNQAPPYSTLLAPCFVRGAKIVTSRGPIAIEKLRKGDLIQTKDHDLQPLRWVGFNTIRKEVMEADPRRYPVRVRAGALGHDTPVRDCYFSRQHRILVTSPNHNKDVLIPVKDLIGLPGIELADDWEGDVDYGHLVFDNHEVVISDGAQTESMLLTEYSTSMLGEAQKLELLALRPDAEEMEPAREIVAGKAARQLLRKLANRGLSLQSVPEFL